MITAGQQGFINKALPIFKRDERIAGAALGGSYVRGAMDEYSDLNFIVAIMPGHVDSVMAERHEIAEKLGTLLSYFPGNHAGLPNMLICLYDEPLIHVDLHFIPLEALRHRTEDPVIIYERGSLLTDEFAREKASAPSFDMQWAEDRFWVWIHYAANRVARGELFDVLTALSELRVQILGPMMQIKHGGIPFGVRHIEQLAPEETPMLEQTIALHDRKSCIRALKAATDLYIYLRGANKSPAYHREGAQKRALQYLSHISDKFSQDS
ncbi:MAG: aminoglycoside 6-adenylyltransferase [Oscillospiraceae bacterium]|jgi:predicted nucleotidyltransferase|nr:aminoglycoside 6-adenylyltransferase [Oscillospiraceae bacterium]